MSESDTTLETPPPLKGGNLLMRFAVIGMVVGGMGILFLYVGGWFAPQALTPETMVNTFEKVNGDHPGFRRNHAKGVCIRGYFESNGRGSVYSKSPMFLAGRTPVIGRFALAGGQPYAADAAHTVRSMALLFKLRDGEEWRTGMNNIPVFPVKSAQAFHDLLLASAPDPATGKPDPAKMKSFFTEYPESAKALQSISSQPASSGFADSTYNGLNAFWFVNAQGGMTPVRWSMAPFQTFQPFDTNEAGSTNFLFDALIANIHSHALQWHLVVTIGRPGDTTSDATVAWPPDRDTVDVGTLTIDEVESEDESPARDINFDPLILPKGIVGSDDPLLSARSAAYSQSFTRREGEHKEPSAVSTTETQK
jgi:catalase